MLDSLLNDFSYIRDTFDQEGDHNFFGKNFSFFAAEPILFYNNEKDVIVYANSMFTDELNYTIEDLAEWKYSFYPLLNKEDQVSFKAAMDALINGDDLTKMPDGVYKLVGKGKKYSYYRLKVRKLHKSYYYIQLENATKSAIPVLKNNTADQLMNDAESILKFGFSMWDVANDRLYWTKGMYHLMEYEPDLEEAALSPELFSNRILKDASFLRFEQGLKEGLFKDGYSIKYQFKTLKDNIVTVSEHARLEFDENGMLKRVMSILRDISLQEETMKHLSEYQEMMLENEKFLNYGSWESDPEGKNINWTEGMFEIFGYDPADKTTLAINEALYQKHINPADYEKGKLTRGTKLQQQESYRWDYEITDNKGVRKMLSTFGKIILDNNRSIQRIIGTTRDVTELREHEKSLEDKILELNRSNRELEEFAYVASHDLQEPLRKISTFSQRLQLRFGNKLGDDGNTYIARMVAACDNMRKLIDNLLEFSRISLNNPPPELVDLGLVAKQVLEDLDLNIAETNTKVSVGPLPEVEAIASQMQQLFANILSNSIKFRREDVPLEITINCAEATEQDKKQFQLDNLETYYLIHIRDNGVGFEQQYATKIFQLFQRLQGKSEYPGTGIGLSICKKIVTNHKGVIYAESEPGNGAEFFIILPQKQ